MSPILEILRYLIHTALSLLLIAVLLRQLLQMARADFYNPVSQFIVRVTNPLLRPLRRLVPAIGRIDTAGWVLAVLVQCVAALAVLLLAGAGLVNPARLLVWAVLGIAAVVVNLYFFGFIAMIVLSWIAPGAHHPAAALLYQLTEPVMQPFRRLLPPIGGLDLSPILVFVGINVLNILLRGLANAAQLPSGLVIGY